MDEKKNWIVVMVCKSIKTAHLSDCTEIEAWLHPLEHIKESKIEDAGYEVVSVEEEGAKS